MRASFLRGAKRALRSARRFLRGAKRSLGTTRATLPCGAKRSLGTMRASFLRHPNRAPDNARSHAKATTTVASNRTGAAHRWRRNALRW